MSVQCVVVLKDHPGYFVVKRMESRPGYNGYIWVAHGTQYVPYDGGMLTFAVDYAHVGMLLANVTAPSFGIKKNPLCRWGRSRGFQRRVRESIESSQYWEIGA